MEQKNDNEKPSEKKDGSSGATAGTDGIVAVDSPGSADGTAAVAGAGTDAVSPGDGSKGAAPSGAQDAGVRNNLREYRIEAMMSKAELARKAGLSVLTVARIEKGYGCRMDTKRKILKALGLKLADRRKVFEDE